MARTSSARTWERLAVWLKRPPRPASDYWWDVARALTIAAFMILIFLIAA